MILIVLHVGLLPTELAPEIWEADSDSDNDGEILIMSDNLKNVQFILLNSFFFNFVIEF